VYSKDPCDKNLIPEVELSGGAEIFRKWSLVGDP
jgi:hypothetical protein